MSTNSPLPDTWKVPQVFRKRLGQRAGRQRAMSADGHLLLVLHAAPKPGETHRAARLFWRAPDGTWQSNSLGPGAKALEKHLNEYAEAVEELDRAEEHARGADAFFAILRENAPLLRASRNMHATLQDARQMVPEDRDILFARDRAYTIERAAELLRTDTQSGLDCAIARNAEQQARHSHRIAVAGHRLNLMAAAFLPVATIATVFGMNLTHGFEHAFSPWLFCLAVAVGVFLGIVLRSLLSDRSQAALADAARVRAGLRRSPPR